MIFSTTMLAVARAEEKPTLESAKRKFEEALAEQLKRNITPGFSVAWIVDGKTVHAAGYGKADTDSATPATADTIYRAGSVSKLFNAVAAMQLVEQGKLDLDAPISKALPEFSIVVPFADAEPLTIRQMLCHRSGMIREAPVGGYLDPSQPTIAETLASVANCVLVNPPNTKTRYSNVAPTVVGHAVEVQTGKDYDDYQQKNILGPLGMTSSAWRMNDKLRPRLAKAKMRVAHSDGSFHIQTAPQFELGTIPAGNLYTTANDLAKFAAFLMSGGPETEPSPPILKGETIKEMFTPQLVKDATNFGLGFFAGDYRKHKTVQHSGAVYGFSTLFVVMPEEKIGLVILSNSDISMGPVRQLGDVALDLLLEVVCDKPPPEAEKPIEISADDLTKFAGEYESRSYWCRLDANDGKLQGNFSSQLIELTPVGELKFLADGRIMNRVPFEFTKDDDGKIIGFKATGQTFERVDHANVASAPEAWKHFAGSYGSEFIPLVVSIRNGNLYALAENEYDYRLEPVNRVTFRSPPGMYDEEHVVFQTDADGKPIGVVMFNMYLPRREQ